MPNHRTRWDNFWFVLKTQHPLKMFVGLYITSNVRGVRKVDAKMDYIGETERTLHARVKEHRRPSCVTSEVSKHLHKECPDHNFTVDNVKILDRESDWFKRGVKEAIYIRIMEPTLNRDGGRYQLPSIWNNTLRSRMRSDLLSFHWKRLLDSSRKLWTEKNLYSTKCLKLRYNIYSCTDEFPSW